MEKPVVSVIVPVYMVEEYLPECIESLICQTYSDIEIIVVDDGSVDGCSGIIDKYLLKDRRIRAIHKKNGGLVSARKVGLESASGKYVMYVDGDDWVEAGFVESMVKVAEEEEADIVTSGYQNSDGEHFDAIPTGSYRTEEERKLLYRNMLSTRPFYTFGILPFLWNKIFRMDFLRRFQMTVDVRIRVGEDVACLYPALLGAKKIVVTGICMYRYRNRPDSMTARDGGRIDETEHHLLMRYRSLEGTFGIHPLHTDLLRQLRQYLYFNLFLKYPEKLFSKNGEEYLPFGIRRGERVALYGMGQVGGTLGRLLAQGRFCEVYFQTDKFAYGMPRAIQVSELMKGGYNKLVVASWRHEAVEEIWLWLEAMGISHEKILVFRDSEGVCSEAVQLWLDRQEGQ